MRFLARLFDIFSRIISGRTIQSNIPSVSVHDLKDIVKSKRNILVIDVRTDPEFIEGHLPFADDLIPYDYLKYNMGRIPIDKSSEIYFFCRIGRRSGIATSYLISQGYINVYNVSGGIIEKGVVIKGSVLVGNDTKIYSGCYIVGPVVIGDGCEIGPNACIF
ncbi:MAG: rhodanese-like domain-containing protein, partial [candidate division Zixibacteria bacterium]|nr:rhodanese-like domain-containing protein [candidate division Zixibacteria bacterium]